LIDPSSFEWSDAGWAGVRDTELVIYELHVGTFAREGTFAGVESRVDDLASLGVTALELMPIAEFPGRWNWGYDGVDLFAPSHTYGTPDDLRALVDAAHARGLAIVLDVVYNHLGPDGAYLSAFSPDYFTSRHKSPWGEGVNLDGPRSAHVRAFLIENALHWIHEYHIDGLRLDATHTLQDDSRTHFLAELAARVEEESGGRQIVLIAEDERNLDRLVRPRAGTGYGLDAVWADDFHHHVRRLTAGDSEGYFGRFSGSTKDLAATIRQGWFFVGQRAATGETRGTDPSGLPLRRFVVCLQNHDQVGNRALGERLHHQVGLPDFRAASALLLCVPETPLLFMGQEWAASSPFLYFTDHEPGLGRAVTEGRRGEFAAFSAFADPGSRDSIPDPQREETFERSRLAWPEREAIPHAGVRRLYQALLELRKSEPALAFAGDISERGPVSTSQTLAAWALDEDTVALWRRPPGVHPVVLVARLRGAGQVEVEAKTAGTIASRSWEVVLTTEDPRFAEDPNPMSVEAGEGRLAVTFSRPGAILLRLAAVS
jgi:maltooligosyltrehalose trehalohydrolase